MLKVMLLGDSIRLSYREKVTDKLAGRAEVFGPADNCRFAAYTLFSLAGWVPDDDYDVIQWNNGQWDTCHMPDGKIHTPLETYLELQERIAGILRKKTKRLIFATTTPVWPDKSAAALNSRSNEDIDAYNGAAVTLMERLGVEVNDLNTPVKSDLTRYICDDMVHLTDAGVELCAKLVTAKIEVM